MQKKIFHTPRIYITKIFIVSLLVFTITPFHSFAGDCDESTCKIKDAPADVLLDFITDVRSVRGNVKAVTGKVKVIHDKTYKGLGVAQENISKAWNTITNWDGYFSSFQYYIEFPLTQNIPSAIKRDDSMLQFEIHQLEKQLASLIRRGQQSVIVEDACGDISEDLCALNGQSSQSIITNLLKSVTKTQEYIRLSIMGEQKNFSGEIQLTKNNFLSELNISYNSFTPSGCSDCEGEFTEKYETMMDSISNFNMLGQKGIDRWIYAWQLMVGNVSAEEYRQRERVVLARELGRQGLAGSSADAVMGNLERYNNAGGFTWENNLVSNSFNYTKTSVESQFNEFYNDGRVAETFTKAGQSLTDIVSGNPSQDIPYALLAQVNKAEKTTGDIGSSIKFLYESENILSMVQDTSSEKTIGKLIDLHINLTEIINELSKIIPLSEKVCNDQATGIGVCSYPKPTGGCS